MRVMFSHKHEQMSEEEMQYAERKLGRLSRYFNSVRDARVTHSVQRGQRVLEVVVDLNGMMLRAEERHPDCSYAIDAVTEKLEHQVRRLKERLKHHKGRASATAVATILTDVTDDDTDTGGGGGDQAAETPATVVRRKRFAIQPMSVEEASLQMELLHHDFFAFRNAEDDSVNILYRRRSGDYGLLELDE